MKGMAQITVKVPSELLAAVDRQRAAGQESRGAAVRRLLEASIRDMERSDIERTFYELARQWQSDTSILSSARQKAMHPAYQRIIGLGPAILPLLLRELRDNPAHWLWALHAITGASPADGCEDFGQAAAAWLEWGRAHGLVE